MNQHVAFTLRPWAIEDLSSLIKYVNNWQIAKDMTDDLRGETAGLDKPKSQSQFVS